jgi:hypothetical protein
MGKRNYIRHTAFWVNLGLARVGKQKMTSTNSQHNKDGLAVK